MKKIIKIFILNIFFVTLIFAKTINYDSAQNIALKWMEKVADKKGEILPPKAFASINFKQKEEKKPYYIFNLKGGGWVIVADDDINSPILAYSEDSSINPLNMPPQFRWWLKEVSKNLKIAKKLAKQGKLKPQKAYKTVNYDTKPQKAYGGTYNEGVGPLLKTAWGQGKGYNEYCPVDPLSVEGNNHVPTGCVATAMAQIMNYFAWPPQGRGSNSYIPSSNPKYGTQSVNFNTSYNWGEASKAKISYHTGVAVNMDYGPYGSGAYITDADTALRKYFRYKTSGVIKKEDDASWINRLINSLNNGSPVLYQGKGEIVHVFVCDGYKKTPYGYMFHFNWGWSGRGNGWFKINDLAPINTHTFNIKNYAIFDIYPNDPSYKKGFKSYKELRSSIDSSLLSILFLFIIFSVAALNKKRQ
jgi:hypothetical protein